MFFVRALAVQGAMRIQYPRVFHSTLGRPRIRAKTAVSAGCVGASMWKGSGSIELKRSRRLKGSLKGFEVLAMTK